MLRPGNLNGIKTIRSKGARKHLGLGNFAHMGVFGKSAYVAAPAPGSPCPSGSTMVNEACQGDDCCDAPGDCDPPGTVYKECIASAPKPVAKRVAPRPAPVAAARSAAPQGPGDSAEQQALEAELFSLELDAQQGVIPEAGPAPVYTGGGSPGYIPLPRGGSKGPQTTQEKVLSIIAEKYKSEQVDLLDGVKIDFKDSWVHLRKSNTEPIVRVMTEAPDEKQAKELANKFMSEVKGLM